MERFTRWQKVYVKNRGYGYFRDYVTQCGVTKAVVSKVNSRKSWVVPTNCVRPAVGWS